MKRIIPNNPRRDDAEGTVYRTWDIKLKRWIVVTVDYDPSKDPGFVELRSYERHGFDDSPPEGLPPWLMP